MEGSKGNITGAKLVEDAPASVKPITNEQKGGDGEQEKMLENDEAKLRPNSVEPADVKYSEKNGDAKLDFGDLKGAFVGMSKEELMKYANDPFWVRLRWCLFILFWLLWAGMLIGAIMIIYTAPKCEPAQVKSWWQQGPLTKVEDTITDIELTELKNKGIQGLIVKWPFDAYSILLNDSAEFTEFLRRAKSAELNVIIELEPAVSQTWFNKSENRVDGFEDYYIWASAKNGDTSSPPNNWLRPDNQSSWTYSAIRKQYYYSRTGLPNLNFRNPAVVSEFSNIIASFVDAGVKGVQLTGIPYILVNETLTDEIPRGNTLALNDYNFYRHTKTENLMGLGSLLENWRRVVKEKTNNGPFFLGDDLTTLEPYKVNGSLVIDLPKQSQVLQAKGISAIEIVKGLNVTFRVLNNTWPLWEHTTDALPNDVLDIVTFLLPGVNLVNKNVNISKDLLNIRNTPSIMYGNFSYYTILNNTVLTYIRAGSGHPSILVALNPNDEEVNINFLKDIPMVSEEITVKLTSNNYNATNVELKVKKNANNFPISGMSAVVLSYVPK